MDMMSFRVRCFLVFLTFYVQGGLSRDYEANLGANNLLQVCFRPYFSFGFVTKVIESYKFMPLSETHPSVKPG